jgi:phospho-N-acetylmuramoyl-pentapeptide-transferase
MTTVLPFAATLAFTMSLLITLAVGGRVISWLSRLKLGQVIREEGPQAHQAKAGTPSMGGLMIFLPLMPLCWALGIKRPEVWLLLALTLAFAGLGFLDDWLIVRKRSNKGLSARQKLLGQVLLAGLFAVSLWGLGWHTQIRLPFLLAPESLDLGVAYWPLVILVLTGSANAVNLTDGLDGLAATTVSIAASGLGAILLAIAAPETLALHREISIFLAALVGGCLGFLWFNAHPAAVFMGDTGSLGLGAALAGAAILGHLELALMLVGSVFVVETISVMAQVAYFKWTKGKRLLRMSPLHHHFELGGWRETQVVARFSVAGVLFSLWALFLFVR